METKSQRGGFAQDALAIYRLSDSKTQQVHFTTPKGEEKENRGKAVVNDGVG